MREIVPQEPEEDRINLYTLTDIIELTDFEKTIDAAWGTAGVSLTAEAAAKLREGAVIEIVYECDVPVGSEWIGNKALWVAGNDANKNWQMIGYPGDGGVAKNELRWNESGTIVQITSDTLNQYRASDWNNDWAWFTYQAIGPCTITSIKIGTIAN
jgi:hypothetical protein